MKDEKPRIVNLNLKTKHRRNKPKSERLELEIARLERANVNIKDEPAQSAFFERNVTHIEMLKIEVVKQKKLEDDRIS